MICGSPLWNGDPIQRSYNHIAFKADKERLPQIEVKIRLLGLYILPGRLRKPAEGESLYFYDYDGHLFELHAGNLERRMDYYNAKLY